ETTSTGEIVRRWSVDSCVGWRDSDTRCHWNRSRRKGLFSEHTPFLLILFNPPQPGFSLLQPIMTDASGGFALDAGVLTGVGTAPAPGTTNGGNIFVLLSETLRGTVPTVPSTPVPFPPTIGPTPTFGIATRKP